MRVFARELISEEVIPADEGVEGGRGMRDAGGRRPLARRRPVDASKSLKLLRPKSSVVLAHSEAAEKLPVVSPLDPASQELVGREEVRKPPLEREPLGEMSS